MHLKPEERLKAAEHLILMEREFKYKLGLVRITNAPQSKNLLKRKLDQRSGLLQENGLTVQMVEHYSNEAKKLFDELKEENDEYSQRSLFVIQRVCEKYGYSSIYAIAQAVLSIPATSSPVESIFSTAGMCTSDKKANTQAKLLNAKLIVHLNK